MPGLEEREEASRSWYWASRRAIVGAPTFYGESLDIVRAGSLVTWYLVINRRAPEVSVKPVFPKLIIRLG
jgi:hypothetical protein